MLRTRLWMGAVLVAFVVGVLTVDRYLQGWFPFLFCLLFGLSSLACFELLNLIPAPRRPAAWLCYLSVFALVISNWAAHAARTSGWWHPDIWLWIVWTFTAIVLAAFLSEMTSFADPGESVTRIALTIWIAAYIGLLPCFLAQLRWLSRDNLGTADSTCDQGALALALAIFVPKCADIGAYFTGRFLGRHQMAPVLSPKKTWEGVAGGLGAGVIAAFGINRLGPVIHGGFLGELGFGLWVGAAGILGDLAESLIKRDFRQKDASQVVPGFGGILDVVDSVIFAAPVAYFWFKS